MFSSPFSVSAANDFVNSAMNARAVRQDMISGNIANIDTPMYRPRDISFEQVLKKEADKVYGAKEPKLELVKIGSFKYYALPSVWTALVGSRSICIGYI